MVFNFQKKTLGKKTKVYKIGLLGNPNVGKSSLINKILKSNELKTGNWPGVTVAKKTVRTEQSNKIYDFVDLPGVFSFVCPNKVEEITINEILSNKYDCFVQVLDGTNLQNSLYLTMLLKELNINFVMVINFSDRLKEKSINLSQLQLILKKKLILTSIYDKNVAKQFFNLVNDYLDLHNKNKVVGEHQSRCIPQIEWKKRFELYREAIQNKESENQYSDISKNNSNNNIGDFYWYNETINNKYAAIQDILKVANSNLLNSPTHQLLLIQGFLDNNQYLINRFALDTTTIAKIGAVSKKRQYVGASFQQLKKERDKYIKAVYKKCFLNNAVRANWLDRHAWFDKILLNKVLAVPTLLVILFCLFVLIFNFTTPYKNFISIFFVYYLPSALHLLNNHHWYADLLTNGFFNALGTMLSFLPVMYLLFVVLHLVEQSGIISRISFMLDGIFTKFGMNGKSIIPLILGFGCNVGSIYATRAISNKREKKITAMISPFISCSARLVVFALFTSIFFNTYGGLVIFSLYILGVLVAFSLSLIFMAFNKFTCDTEVNLDDKLYDLPKYKIPKISLILRLTNYSVKNYSKRVLRIIIFFTLFVWLINYVKVHNNQSILYYFSYVLKPFFRPLGFGRSWILCVALIPGIIAKETTIATLGLLFGLGVSTGSGGASQVANFHAFVHDFLLTIKASFVELLPNHWFSHQNYGFSNNNLLSTKINRTLRACYPTTNIKLVAYAYMCFILLTIPCITTLGAIRHEYGWKTMLQSTFLGIITPYIITLVIFQSVNQIILHH